MQQQDYETSSVGTVQSTVSKNRLGKLLGAMRSPSQFQQTTAPKPIGQHALTNAPYYGGGLQDKDSYKGGPSSYGSSHGSNRQSSAGTYYGGESKPKLQEKFKQISEQNQLIHEKHWWQKVIFTLSFLVNFSLNYDLNVCLRIQVSITGDNSLPRVQFIRLTCAIAVILLGVTIEQLSDIQSRRAIFSLIIAFTLMKMFYEVETYFSPLSRIDSEQTSYIKNLNKFG
jgi:hypothetical protein